MSIRLNGIPCSPDELNTRLNSLPDEINYIDLYIPHGNWSFNRTVRFPVSIPVTIHGDGWSSVILWSGNGNLFEWASECQISTFRDFAIEARSDTSRTEQMSAFRFNGGLTKSNFSNVYIHPQNKNYDEQNQAFPDDLRSCIWIETVADSVFINGCQFWYLTGTGIRLARGSEVRISNCRILGSQALKAGSRPPQGSHGIHLTGDMGGVHIDSSDIAGLEFGVRIEKHGSKHNREIFISQSTLDVCDRGLALEDSSYVSITGCWAASCFRDNIWVKEGGIAPYLNISGGTIFNAGAQAASDETEGMHGITINSGSFCLSGVMIRQNRGIGLHLPALQNTGYGTVTGCTFTNNRMNKSIVGHSSRYVEAGINSSNTTA